MRFYAHGRRTSLGGGPLFLIAYMIGALIYGLIALFVFGALLLVKFIEYMVHLYQRRQ